MLCSSSSQTMQLFATDAMLLNKIRVRLIFLLEPY